MERKKMVEEVQFTSTQKKKKTEEEVVSPRLKK